MKKALVAVLLVLAIALWVGSSYRAQGQVGPDNATVQAQLTVVAKVVPTPTP